MLQHDSFGYNKIKKTNKKCCCIRKYCLVLNLPQYKTIFLIHLCLLNSRDISIDFFLLDQFSNRHDNRANELALSLMHDDSCAFFTLSEIGFRPPRAARASSRMLVLPQWGGGSFGKFDALASSSLLSASQFFRFDFSECHGCIFFYSEYFNDGYALFQVYFCKTNNASFQRLRYFSDLGSKIEDIHIYNCCSTR